MTHLRLFPQALPQSLRVSSQCFNVAKRPEVWSLVDAHVPSRPLHSSACRSNWKVRGTDMGFSEGIPAYMTSNGSGSGKDGYHDAPKKTPLKTRTYLKLRLAAGQPANLTDRIGELTDTWKVSHDGKGLTRKFNFMTFDKAWLLMDRVAQECKVQNHHPEWTNNGTKIKVRWVTHNPPGLSVKDAHMAEFCNKVADEIGGLRHEKEKSPGDAPTALP